MTRRRRVTEVSDMDPQGPGTLVLDVVQRLAVRYEDAARMLGISENMLRDLVQRGKIQPPVGLSPNVVLFDVATLTQDWQAIRREKLGDPLKSRVARHALDDLLG